MDVGLRDLPPQHTKITSRAQRPLRLISKLLGEIVNDPSRHRKLQCLATFQLTNDCLSEKGQASKLKAQVIRKYGAMPEICGLSFYVARNTEETEEYLAAVYDPRRIVPGRWEEHEREMRRRETAKYERWKERNGKSESDPSSNGGME
jgi:hypothetical protein